LAFEHRELLSQREDFKGRVASTADEDADHGEDDQDKFKHKITLVTWRNLAWIGHPLPTKSR